MTATSAQGQITFEQFQHMLAEILQVDETRLTAEASFVTDLQVDSIKLVELMLGLEENGISIPMEAAWDVQTVGDAYRVYQENASGDNPQYAVSG